MIPPNTPPTAISLNEMWLLMHVTDASFGIQPDAIMMMGYKANGEPTTGDMYEDYISDWALQWSIPLIAWFCTTCYFDYFGFYWMTSAGLQWALASPAIFPLFGGTLGGTMPAQVSASIKKKTARYPKGRPRLRMPFVPRFFSSDNKSLNALGSVAANLVATQLNTSLTSHGIQFSPSSWSRASSSMEPVLSTFVLPTLGREMRRGAFRSAGDGIIMSSFNWDY